MTVYKKFNLNFSFFRVLDTPLFHPFATDLGCSPWLYL